MSSTVSSKVSSKDKVCQAWCTPLILYIVITAIGLLGMLKSKAANKTNQLVTSFIWAAFWSFVMYTLCKNCREGWAWALFLVPFILWIIMAAFVLGVLATKVKGCVTHPNGGCQCELMLDSECKGEVVSSCKGYCSQ